MNARLKRRRSDVRRIEILAGAQRAIRGGGGMREIAAACGLSPGNLYYYFKDKQELVTFCQAQALAALEQVVREARAKQGAAAQLDTLVRGHLKIVLDEAAGGTLHLELADRELVGRRDRYERAVRTLIKGGQKRGEVRAGDAKLAAFALLGALNWAARWFRPGGAYDLDAVASGYSEQMLRGLLTRGAEPNGLG